MEEENTASSSSRMLLSSKEASAELISNAEGEIVEIERGEADIVMDMVPLEADPEESAPAVRSTTEIETLYLMEKLLRQLGEPFQKTVLALQSDLVSAAKQLAFKTVIMLW